MGESPECVQSLEVCGLRRSSDVQIGKMRNEYHYELQPSVWDAVLFMGIKGFHWHEHLIMGVAYLVNCILQGVLCMVVVHLGSAVALEDVATTDWEVWRERAQPWEVTGVCGSSLDYSLSSSSLQMSVVHEARDYLEEAIFGFSLGPLLTVTVIVLWSGTTVQNAKALVDLTVALWTITDLSKFGKSMQFNEREKTIISISLRRFVWMISVVLEQASVIAILSVYGCLWMAQSMSVSELLLNSVSLAFITDTDELVFATILPTIVKKLVKETPPLRLPPKPLMLSFVHIRSLASLSTIIMFASFFGAFPVSQTSRRISEAILGLCPN